MLDSLVIWGLVQQSLDSLQGWRSHIPSRNLFQCCTILRGSIFSSVLSEFPCMQLSHSQLRSFCEAPLRRLWLYLLSRSTFGSGKLQLGCSLSLLHTEQTWSFQPLLVHHVLWSCDHFICSPVELLQFVNISVVLGDQNWTTHFMCPHEWQAERKNHLSICWLYWSMQLCRCPSFLIVRSKSDLMRITKESD